MQSLLTVQCMNGATGGYSLVHTKTQLGPVEWMPKTGESNGDNSE
jgi:hypothetical protein